MQNMSPIMLPIMLNKLKKRLDNANRDILKEHGLSRLHLLYLMVLFENSEGMTLRELTAYLGFDKANTSRAVSQLAAKHCVEKKTQGELELKYKVMLTARGREIASGIYRQNEAANRQLIQLFTPEELALLSNIGGKLWDYLSAEEVD